jgi:protoporphyrinogen IX oxidase
MFNYVLALHLIFVITWFAGLFYIVRLFIYATEACEKPEPDKTILLTQLLKMQRLLWSVITVPSSILTLIFGGWMLYLYYQQSGNIPGWLQLKLVFVFGLYLYHFSCGYIFTQQKKGIFKYTSQQLRLWNEVATLFLVSIVFIVILKDTLNWLYGLCGLVVFAVILMLAIRIYKKIRSKN